MGTVPYFAHKWNQTLATKLRLVFVINKNARAGMNKAIQFNFLLQVKYQQKNRVGRST